MAALCAAAGAGPVCADNRVAAAAGGGAAAGRGAAAGDGAKTLRRLHDPVVLDTGRLAALPTRETATLRLHFENLLELAPGALPVTCFDRSRPEGFALADGTTPKRCADGDREWFAHSSDAGTMLHAFVIPELWRAWGITRGTIVRAAPTAAGVPVLEAGYTLEHMTRLREAGRYDLLLASIVLPERFQPGDEEDALAMLRAPLVGVVRALR